jgi:hypothetical protein
VGKGRFQDSGVRSQESGVRMESICFLPTAYCLLPTAFEGGGMERAFARMTTLDKMSPPTGKEKTSNFKK